MSAFPVQPQVILLLSSVMSTEGSIMSDYAPTGEACPLLDVQVA